MKPFHERQQRPVGQGCFHTARVEGTSGPIRYVYDCGALSKYKSELAASVDAYHAEISNAAIDILFISHLHADHVSGLERLCTPVNVQTIVMPLVNVEDRLIAFARTASEDAAVADDEFYRLLIASPVEAVSRFGPDQVILVTRGEGPAPIDRPEAAAELPGRAPGDGPRGRRDGVEIWRLNGRGRVEIVARGVASASAPARKVDVYQIPDTRGFDLAGVDQLSWLLAPYVDPTVVAGRGKFLATLGKLLGKGKTTIDTFLKADTEGLLLLLVQYKNLLAAAYEAVVKKNLNVTSLCLYSGPSDDTWPACTWWARLGEAPIQMPPCITSWPSGDVRVGWIGSGDAALKSVVRRKAFLDHYAAHPHWVATFLLPHHGSVHNFHSALLDGLAPRLALAAAAPYSTWKHPSTPVLQASCARGIPLWVTNHSSTSGVMEWVWVDPHVVTSASS